MVIERFEQLDVWREAHAVVLHIYRITASLPPNERFGLISQMRRAAVSVPANIAEGFKRRGSRDKIHFYNMAQSSLSELCYFILLCNDLEYTHEQSDLNDQCDKISRMLHGLMKSVRDLH